MNKTYFVVLMEYTNIPDHGYIIRQNRKKAQLNKMAKVKNLKEIQPSPLPKCDFGGVIDQIEEKIFFGKKAEKKVSINSDY